jgi:hypothetical protein
MEKRGGGVMDKCTGVMGYLLGHSFQKAITKGAPAVSLRSIEGSASMLLEMVEKARPQTYHGIYCKRCGKVINA